MADAGLTHGGFYAHFDSKDALTAAAITASFADSSRRFQRELADLPPKEALAGWIDLYVSERHRDGPERGCALPALAAEVSRSGDAARAALANGIAAMMGQLSAWLTAVNGDSGSGLLAAGLLAEAVGAVSLARALGAGEASDAILESTRTSLKRRAGVMR